jgi:predicted flavoprotein YhiN
MAQNFEAADVLVIGGGPAGMAAAIAAARSGARVALAERMDRVGRKLLATGSGRCNLSNMSIEPARYHGSDVGAALGVLEAHGREFAGDFFGGLGVLTAADREGRVYPKTHMASTVLDALRAEMAFLGVRELVNCAVSSLAARGGRFRAGFAHGGRIDAARVIAAAGGKASAAFGSDGSGYALLEGFGHRLAPPAPALVQLRLGPGGAKGLKGLRACARASLVFDGNGAGDGKGAGAAVGAAAGPDGRAKGSASARDAASGAGAAKGAKDAEPAKGPDAAAPCTVYGETGEVLFTDYGISGIPILNLSGYLAPYISRAAAGGAAAMPTGGGAGRSGAGQPSAPLCPPGFALYLDLFPELGAGELSELLRARIRARPGYSLEQILSGWLNRRIARAAIAGACAAWRGGRDAPTACAPANAPASSLGGRSVELAAAALKRWRHEITGTMGFSGAQATYGGLLLDGFSPGTLESRLAPGLYAAGEILDIVGDCGGYNLHWAWASGYAAGQAAAASMLRS